ncbi:hypothetical protein D3C80_2193280 [compost metagenome]
MDETGIAQKIEGAVDGDGGKTLLLAAQSVDKIVGPHRAAALHEFAIDALADWRKAKVVLAT